jgi:hypothetical protein
MTSQITFVEFMRSWRQDAPRLMWFLGSGASRSSGLPTASDITWDLKRKYYCAQENQDVQVHDVSNKAVQARIQSYMDSKGCPPLGDIREYSFYFERMFGEDYAAQQKYIRDVLCTGKISLTIGHRALAALLQIGHVRVAFTTNFDEVVETAYASIAGCNLAAFHLEGSYAATDALNADQFPLYAKIHGDFRYQSIKNLSKDLLSNDEQIQKCLVAAATRFGMIVAGYSGRDENVISLFRTAIDQNNAFPHGLFWTAPRISGIAKNVQHLIEYAHSKRIKCGIVETGTFDEMLSKMWRQTPDKSPELDQKVRSAGSIPVSITLPGVGTQYPMLRTNALRITRLPAACGAVDYDGPIVMRDVRSRLFEVQPDCTLAYTDRILFWGVSAELEKVIEKDRIRTIGKFEFENLPKTADELGSVKALIEETMARALLHAKPVNLRKDGKTWYAVVKHSEATHSLYEPLRVALGSKGSLAQIYGTVYGLRDVHWSEAVSIRVEERNGSLWLLLRPDVWISPLTERENTTDFLRTRKLKRYNTQSFELLSAWIQILLGNVGQGKAATVTAFPKADFSASFEVSTRTAYSRHSTDG